MNTTSLGPQLKLSTCTVQQDDSIKVLLIEDDPVDAESVVRMLAPWNATQHQGQRFEIIHFDNLFDGLSHLLEENVDLILLDLFLPDSNGTKTFDSVRQHATDIPIVVLSGLDDEAAATEAVVMGAQDFLVKGEINRQWLIKSLCHAIERKRLEVKQEKLIAQLQHAVDEVQTLRDLLSICSWCGKVKDDDNSYIHIESYIQKHTAAQLTHGLCPCCAVKLKEDL